VKRYPLLVPCLLIVSAVALSACGGGGGGSSDEGKIEEAIETAATTSDPSNCTELETQNFLEQNEPGEGAAAVTECEEKAEENEEVAESVDVSNVSVNGEKASAEAAFSGSTFDGQALEIDLVKEGDNWKLDEVAGFASYDPQKLAEAFEEQFEGNEEIPAKVAACITEAVGSASQAEAEELVFSGSAEPIEELAVNCQ
jgi:hypothetical protein